MNPEPFNTNFLTEQDGHKIFYSQFGNPQGEAIVMFHGGPGSKSQPKNARFYDLSKYHVIMFDQRGCGKSLPAGEIKNNTLSHLIHDTERLREELKIQKWFVSGASWGATLALAYAEAHPENVKGLMLSSIFLARVRDIDWAFTKEGGVERLFPDLWEERQSFLNKYETTPKHSANDLLAKITSEKTEIVKDIVAGVISWEGNLMNAQEDLVIAKAEDMDDDDITAVKVFLHYESNQFFLSDNQLLNDLEKIQSIPTIIVHGRYDVLCPVEQAWDVKKGLNDVQIVILPTSNHKLTAEGELSRGLAFNQFLQEHTLN